MQLYPAIDMRDGQCVRLTQGAFDLMTVYSSSPAEVAVQWEACGATYLHLVDLDGALKGHSVNRQAIQEVIRQVHIPVQLGGGIRTLETVDSMLELGVTRVIIGTKAVESPEFIETLIRRFGSEHIVIGVDARDGKVAIQGWEQVSSLYASDLCRMMKEIGVEHIVYTDISRDGMLSGPNVASTRNLTLETGLDIIASGGVSSMKDLHQLNQAQIKGAIIGKALYEKRIDLKEAVLAFE